MNDLDFLEPLKKRVKKDGMNKKVRTNESIRQKRENIALIFVSRNLKVNRARLTMELVIQLFDEKLV